MEKYTNVITQPKGNMRNKTENDPSAQRVLRLPASEDPSNGPPDSAGEPGFGQDLWQERSFPA